MTDGDVWELTKFFLEGRENPLTMRKRFNNDSLTIRALAGWRCVFYLNVDGEIDEIAFLET